MFVMVMFRSRRDEESRRWEHCWEVKLSCWGGGQEWARLYWGYWPRYGLNRLNITITTSGNYSLQTTLSLPIVVQGLHNDRSCCERVRSPHTGTLPLDPTGTLPLDPMLHPQLSIAVYITHAQWPHVKVCIASKALGVSGIKIQKLVCDKRGPMGSVWGSSGVIEGFEKIMLTEKKARK